MLAELRIRNYALIDDLTVEFSPGLNVLSGETGAGKSIIIGALTLLLGDKPDADMIRAGADTAQVEGRFDLGNRLAGACSATTIWATGTVTRWRRRTGTRPAKNPPSRTSFARP